MKLGNRVNANATLMDIGYHQSSNPIYIAIRPGETFNQAHCVHNPFQLPFLEGKLEMWKGWLWWIHILIGETLIP